MIQVEEGQQTRRRLIRGGCPVRQGPMGNSGDRRSRKKKMGEKLYCGFRRKEQVSRMSRRLRIAWFE